MDQSYFKSLNKIYDVKKIKEISLFLSYICQMTKNLDKEGLKSIVDNYDLFFIDLWGVIHNGIELFKSSIEVLNKLTQLNKEYILLTNAPRPNADVKNFIEKMGIDKEISSKVYTSGEAALDYLITNFNEKKFFHIGPPRDFSLFKTFEKNKINDLNEAEYLLCTGLFDDQDKELYFYKKLLANHFKKIMVCTNPDLIVDRGKVREFCAGSVAKVFEELDGKVEYFGKPHPKVYIQATNLINRKVLCIGDNLNTDIKGANFQNFSSLLISNGIHREEIKQDTIYNLFNRYEVTVDFLQTNLKW